MMKVDGTPVADIEEEFAVEITLDEEAAHTVVLGDDEGLARVYASVSGGTLKKRRVFVGEWEDHR